MSWKSVWNCIVQDLAGLSEPIWEFTPACGQGPFTARVTCTADMEFCDRVVLAVDGAMPNHETSASKKQARHLVIASIIAGATPDALALRQAVTALRVAGRFPNFHQSLLPIPYPEYNYTGTVVSLLLRRQVGRDVLVYCEEETTDSEASHMIAPAIPFIHATTVAALALELYKLTFSSSGRRFSSTAHAGI